MCGIHSHTSAHTQRTTREKRLFTQLHWDCWEADLPGLLNLGGYLSCIDDAKENKKEKVHLCETHTRSLIMQGSSAHRRPVL